MSSYREELEEAIVAGLKDIEEGRVVDGVEFQKKIMAQQIYIHAVANHIANGSNNLAYKLAKRKALEAADAYYECGF